MNHDLFTGVFMPRPIAWVSTIDRNDVPNLAPFSSLGSAAAGDIVTFVISLKKNGDKKDTLVNIEHTKDFCINIVTRALAPRMNVTALGCDPDFSEFKLARLTPEEGTLIDSPSVAESPLSVECKLREIKIYGRGSLIIGKALRFIQKEEEFYPIGRGIGLNEYIDTKDGSIFYMVRPKGGE